MSTSHYSSRPSWRPARNVAPNTRRASLWTNGAVWALTMLDILALGTASNPGEGAVFALLTVVNVVVILRAVR